MPLGINRTDLNNDGTTYKDGTPVTLPLDDGTPITLPHDFGNDIPTSGTEQNLVTWTPTPTQFGNVIVGSAPPPADNMSHVTVTATYGDGAADADLSAAGATFTLSWDIPIPPIVETFNDGVDWVANGVPFHFVSADLSQDVIVSDSSLADFFNASQGGGVDASGIYNGVTYAWEFFTDETTMNQLYQGTEAAPIRLVNGVYTFDDGATSADPPDPTNQSLVPGYTMTITSSYVPPPL